MKKMIISFVAIFVMAIVLVSFKGTKTNDAASINKDFTCGMFDGDGGFVVTDASHSVVTSSGNSTLKCSAKGVANSTGGSVKYEGFGCNTFLGFTTDSREIVSTSGNATLTCQVH